MKLKVHMSTFLFLTLRKYSVGKASSRFQVGLAGKEGTRCDEQVVKLRRGTESK